MGGSSDQVIGYKYFAGLMVALGNRLEKLIAVNPDNRGWIVLNASENQSIEINEPNIFGGDKGEGGWVGRLDICLGSDDQAQNEYLAIHENEFVSAFPNLSYVVFKGLTNEKGFQLVSMSGMLKEVLYWPSRVHVKNNGEIQWHDFKSEVPLYIPSSEQPSNNISGTIKRFWNTSINDINLNGSNDLNYDTEDSDYLINEHPSIIISGYTGDFTASFNMFVELYREIPVFVDVVFHYSIDEDANFNLTNLPSPYLMGNAERESVGIYDDSETKYYYRSKGLIKKSIFGISMSSDGGEFHNAVSQTVVYIKARFDKRQKLDYPPDINPIHKIREILTDYTAMNKPESDLNEQNFIDAANRVFDDGLGISWAIQEKTCKDAIDELLFHIEAGIRVNRQSGQYEIVLFRDDLLDLDQAQVFNKTNLKKINFEIATSDDLVNVLNVKFYDRDYQTSSSFVVYENGNIRTFDREITENIEFPYFMNRRNAELVANWKLKQLSTPVWKGSFTVGIYEARKLNRYDVIKLSWPDLNIIDLPVRVMKISLGDSLTNEVSIDFIEVAPYSSFDYQATTIDPPTSVVLPPQPNQSIVFEMPYLEAVQRFGQTQVDAELANNPDLGYLMVATEKPQNNSINALLFTDNGTGYQQASIVNYCPVVQLDQNIGYLDTSFAVKNVSSISQADIGTLILCEEELMVYESYDAETKILTVKRAALDTHPKPHLQDAVFYFYDAFSAFDSEQYVLSEVIDAKVLTTTPSGMQELLNAPALELDIFARPIRPYPPANIKINDTYFIESIVVSNDVVVTWVDRNRVQQTGGSVIGWIDETVSKEIGVTYSIELSSEDVVLASDSNIDANTYTFASTLLIPNKPHKLRLWSVRDGYESYQIFEHNFFGEAISLILTATVYEDEVIGSTVQDAQVTVDADETVKANFFYDGSGIKGKALPGSNITIEVED